MLDVNKIINKNPSAAFAFAVWRFSYLIGILVGIYLSFSFLNSTLTAFDLIRGLFSTALFFIGWTAIWTLTSSMIFVSAYLAKTASRKIPILIFTFLPLPISFLTFFAYYFIFLMDKEELADLGFMIVLIFCSFILIPINVIVWVYALSEYKKSIKESAKPVNYPAHFALFLLLLVPFILSVVIFLKNRVPKDFHLPPKSTLKTALYSEPLSADDFIAIKSSEDAWQAIYKVQLLPNGESKLINLQTQQVVSIPLGSIDALATNFDAAGCFFSKDKIG